MNAPAFTAPRQEVLRGLGDIGNRAEPMRHREEDTMHAALVVVMHGRPGTGIGRLLLLVFPGLPKEMAGWRAKRMAELERERCADVALMTMLGAETEE